MQPLLDVFQNYAANRVNKVARYTGSADQVALRYTLPDFFKTILETLGRASDFLVEGSFGNGNIARVPWVGVFRRSITTSAQSGFYIVLLFTEDLSRCYLSLNQGFTEFSQQFSARVALEKIQDAATRSGRLVPRVADAIFGPIDLVATGDLGKGYEAGAIESYEYFASQPPDPETVGRHFRVLLTHYDALYESVGSTLRSLTPSTEGQFQEAALDKAKGAARKGKDEQVSEPSGGVTKPELVSTSSTGYMRRVDVAAAALLLAAFRCEADAIHSTFMTAAKNVPYVEAHHLIPLSRQAEYEFSLDVRANIIALCPNCHRLLHYGRAKDKKPILQRLLRERSIALHEKQIQVQEATLFGYYNSNLLGDQE
jgi:5-methylcytosine-specific restriction protein A